MTGRLGAFNLYAGVPQAIYVCDKTVGTTLTVSICNRSNVDARIRIALSTSATSPTSDEYLEYDAVISAKGVLERTGIVVGTGEYVVVQSNVDGVSAMAYGVTQGEDATVVAVSTAPFWISGTNLDDVVASEPADVAVRVGTPTARSLTYSLASGTLPTSLSLNTNNGVISGTVAGGSYVEAGQTSAITVNVNDGVNTISKSFNITKKWRDGSTEALAGTSASAIKTLTGTATSGNFWIRPVGQPAYQIYCDMFNQGGGWMLVGVGRNGRTDEAAGFRNWFNNTGDITGAYRSSLKQANLSGSTNYNPRYMPVNWISAACGGTTWNSVEMIINRIELADSLYFRNGGDRTFLWTDFRISNAPYPLQYSYWTGTWLTGSNTYNFTNAYWTDTLNSGSPVTNDQPRSFTWTWDGHSITGIQYTGWSAGSGVTGGGISSGPDSGFTVGTEGHALQMVNIFVR